jgi:hypothetical protein
MAKKEKEIIDYYYNPNLECTCEAIFNDTHRSYCKRRQRPECPSCKIRREKNINRGNL